MKKCPRCKKMKLDDEQVMNSLSRRDRKTYICNDCGSEESMIDVKLQLPGKTEKDFVKFLKRKK